MYDRKRRKKERVRAERGEKHSTLKKKKEGLETRTPVFSLLSLPH